ncbi:biotin-dependent carboxyltransferase family protein [Bacillus sp. FJAT-45350]|uniref:5-oxoprolinase subunit C family protein n=1 Tax=Bacillus sp. FJAT-45350 TaxID=2011014 RepID=UPI000BB68F4C|nr:biotin-dependent carboxyltransferase family protein [Bacillus sp. FJAT-45350]
MDKLLFRVIKGGLLTTVQDQGRVGYQRHGIVVSGVVDPYSSRIGNILVGNEPYAPVLEITLVGPMLEVLESAVIAICGGNFTPMVNNKRIDMWKSIIVYKGDKISFGKRISGARAYICNSGGVSVPIVLGSHSTYTKGVLGGFNGRSLIKGDILYRNEEKISHAMIKGRILHNNYRPTYEAKKKVRVVLGPDLEFFTAEGKRIFLKSKYEVTKDNDRMGMRLHGSRIELEGGADILSDAISFGTIQVPASGQPIIMLADRQTTGGYPRIGAVITSDLSIIAQLVPGDVVCFQAVSIEEAQELYIRQEKLIKNLKRVSDNL